MKEKFFGLWNLVAANFYKQDGSVVKLYGENPEGLFVYDKDGTMAVQIMLRERPALPQGRNAENALEDYLKILSGYIAYFGTYEVDETLCRVIHHVRGSLIPNWVGTDLVRHYEFAGNRLFLRFPPTHLRGEIMSGELVWEKMT